MTPKVLLVQAHARDCQNITVISTTGDDIFNHCGYMLGGLGIGTQGSDDVHFAVDIETGKIVGWDAERVKSRIAEIVENNEVES